MPYSSHFHQVTEFQQHPIQNRSPQVAACQRLCLKDHYVRSLSWDPDHRMHSWQRLLFEIDAVWQSAHCCSNFHELYPRMKCLRDCFNREIKTLIRNAWNESKKRHSPTMLIFNGDAEAWQHIPRMCSCTSFSLNLWRNIITICLWRLRSAQIFKGRQLVEVRTLKITNLMKNSKHIRGN